MNMIDQGSKILVKVDGWAATPNGRLVNLIYGPAFVVAAEDLLGRKPTHSTNWFLKIGAGDEFTVIAGCQVHYFTRTDIVPSSPEVWVIP